ncbi:Lrp/AsnC family transcriptional regulator [Candidatus Micrarchaeota archaeon]|nr:Lrp/AsnC family transcriptional regulator [Candidatus Micrarchaeota archaeon]
MNLVKKEPAQESYVADKLDERILRELSRNARDSFREIARRLKVSTSTVVQRVKRLESEGIINGYSPLLNHARLGYEFTGLIEVTIRKGALLEVQRQISNLPGVVAVYDVTGLSDSMVLVRARNRGEFSKIVKQILSLDQVERSNTHVILNVIKEEYRQLL